MIMVNILALAQVKIIVMEPTSLLLTTLNIQVLDIIIMELIFHNWQHHITLMMDFLANHFSLPDQTNIHTIILIEIIYLISLLITGMIMMRFCASSQIQCENDYIMQVFMNVFSRIYYIMHVFDMFLPTTDVFMHFLYV